jgi:hypothetical protein
VAQTSRLEAPQTAAAAGLTYLHYHRVMLAAIVSARAGDSRRAREVLAQTRAAVSAQKDSDLAHDLDYDEAFLQLQLGDKQAALRLLSNYLAARPTYVGMVRQHPRWKTLRSEPQFIAAIRKAELLR